MNYNIDDLVKVAKRENNTKRTYLYVNPLQGKHIPVSPSKVISVFSELAEKLENKYVNEKILVIGFAETATGIGTFISILASNVIYYLNTTRENIENAEYLFFSESHSHATEQRLVVNNFDNIIEKIDRIIFAEDEVTTGNTIIKLIHQINNKYSDRNIKYGIISILNSMSDERLQQLIDQEIYCDFIKHIPFEYNIKDIDNYTYCTNETLFLNNHNIKYRELCPDNYWNSRLLENTEVIRNKLEAVSNRIIDNIRISGDISNILILGTEEFMAAGLYLGKKLENLYSDINVCFHATTRSPIEISKDKKYPLFNRAEIESLYEEGRKNFIYNLKKYDRVIIYTDANPVNKNGLNSLISALEYYGNDSIRVIYWS